MPWVVPVVMAAGAIYGGISGAAKQKAQQEAAQRAMAQAAAQYNGIIPPEVRAQLVEELRKQGVYTPEMESAISAGESQWKDYQENSELVNAQMGALQQMQGVSRTGFQASDRAALNKVRNEGARDVEAKRQQIIQQMQARGQGGSGAELALQIAASQQGADQASEEADRLAAQAQQNALQAIADSSNMASQGRASDLATASAKNNATDEMNRFNVSNARDVAQRNVSSKNAAQAADIQESQRIYEQNIANRKQEADRMEAARQQEFKNKMDKAGALSNIYTGNATQAIQAGKDQAAQQQGMWSGIGQLGGSVAQAGMANSVAAKPSVNVRPDAAGGTTSSSTEYLNMAHGGRVPGTAAVNGDSYSNDTVPAMLSPGEVVVPRSKAKDPEKAKEFVEKNMKKEKMPSDAEVAAHIIKSGDTLHAILAKYKKGIK